MESHREAPKAKRLSEWYDQLYKENPDAFSDVPEPLLLKSIEHIPAHGRVLEIGAGQGRNALALAKLGFAVHATDISSVGIQAMRAQAEATGLDKFTVEMRDARSGIEGSYELIVAAFLLHHSTPDDARRIITDIQDHTTSGGVNYLSAFTKGSDLEALVPGTYFPTADELRTLYEGWEMLAFEEVRTRTRQRREDGSLMYSMKATLSARKP